MSCNTSQERLDWIKRFRDFRIGERYQTPWKERMYTIHRAAHDAGITIRIKRISYETCIITRTK